MIIIRTINSLACLASIALLLISCSSPRNEPQKESVNVTFQAEDREILDHLFEQIPAESGSTTSGLVVEVGRTFLGTPYVAHTLETEEEELVVNLREMDCTTFAEYCLAIARTIESGSESWDLFTSELQTIRYRDGRIEGYASRLHYFCDWIYNNQQKGLVRDVSEEIGGIPDPKKINFMSTHPESYPQLEASDSLARIIAAREKEITGRERYYIPESRISEIEDLLKEGDIVGITTGTEGIAVSHVGILVRVEGRIHLLHASSAAEKVVISDITLEEYLHHSKTATGIMVARPL
jgi:hypothetical protein